MVVYRAVKPIRRVAAIAAAACALVAALSGTGVAPAAAATDPADWTAFLYSGGHSSYNAAATAITPADASTLTQAWQWATPASQNAGSNSLFASPTVANGVVYIGAEDGNFYAVNEASQTVLWSDFLGLDTPKTGSCIHHAQGIIATATVADDPATGTATVYVNAPDGYLYALDAQTGAVIWKGLVDTPSATANDYYSWSSPLVANGKVYVGISSDSDCPLVPGGLVAFDQSTGGQVARWIDVPKTGGSKRFGGSVWSSPALLSNGDIAVTTGNAYKGTGQPLYNESIVRLDPNTLQVLDWWQLPTAQQIGDGDFGASPTIWTATINGVSTPMVGACNKNGLFYAFAQDDLSAGPVWQTRITVPYPGGAQECASSAVYDGNQLIIGGGAATTINGQTYAGSVQSLDPATGTPNWQTGLPSRIVATPTEDGGGVVAAQTYSSTNKSLGVYLLNAATGASLGLLRTGQPLFGQAVFDKSDLIIGAGGSFGLQAFAVPAAGPPITKVTPNVVVPGSTTTVKLTGEGFSGSPTVAVSGGPVTVKSVSVVSPTTLKVVLFTSKTAALGSYNIAVSEPGPIVDSCTSCLTIGAQAPRPVPTSIHPGSFPQGSHDVAASIAGSNFQSGATVTSHAGIKISVVNVASGSQLDVTVSVASTIPPGTYNLFVHNPDGYSGPCTGCLTVP